MQGTPTITAQRAKRLALFLDGTWNTVGDNTNVWRLKSLCSEKSADGRTQLSYYDIGVNGSLGGMVGLGLSANIIEGYEWLIDNYDSDDEIFIFGFSRGAYTARSLAGLIAKCGLLKPGAPLGVNQLYERYRRDADKTIWTLLQAHDKDTLGRYDLEEKWMLKYSQAIPIKVVAVWDTVGALGIPAFRVPGVSRSTLGFLHTGLRLPIKHGFQALAIDEHRRAFSPTLWTVRRPRELNATAAEPRQLASVEQRWFVGAHANVGGGCRSDLLAQVPLRWIMKKASLHGLAFRSDVELDGDEFKGAISDSFREFMRGAYSVFTKRFYRPIGAAPREADNGTHINVNETIDSSVFDRWRADPSYRPQNLAAWAQNGGVDPSNLSGAVRTDNPGVAAPE